MHKTTFTYFVLLMLGLASCLNGCSSGVKLSDTKENIIFETDLGNDIDDALALDLLYKYARSSKINLLGISVNKLGRYPAELLDIFNTWYGMPDLPISVVRDGVESVGSANDYAQVVCQMKSVDGNALFRRSVEDYGQEDYLALLESSSWYRKTLSQAEDSSVTIVSVGFASNLVHLLESPSDSISPLSGKELIERKVKKLVIMAGCFCDSTFHEYNVVTDIPSAQAIFHDWPTEVVASPFELGDQVVFPGEKMEQNLYYDEPHPLVEVYKAFDTMPYDRQMWDITALVYAVEGGSAFGISEKGVITVSDEGSTVFRASPEANRRYLYVSERQADALEEKVVRMICTKIDEL